jgi:peptide/nickel transport system substrate-binding protein
VTNPANHVRGRRRLVALSTIVLVAGLLTMQHGARGAGMDGQARSGGIVRISLAGLAYVDPALAYHPSAWGLIDTTCARLMRYPDKPAPEGYRLVPEVAAAYPRVSRDGKTWTFALRSGFRFSDGTPVRATAFARAIARTLAPGVPSVAANYTQAIVGAADVQAGRTASPAGVVARGNTLVVRFTQPVSDFPAQTSMPFFCAVPPALPADPEGVGAFPGAGPYYIAEYRAGQRVVIRRNRFYRGTRPHHVNGFDVDLTAGSFQDVVDRIERGDADWGYVPPIYYFEQGRRLAAKYGVNRSQFFIKPGLRVFGFALNTSRPLFRDNPRLRRAVNFAIDRRALGRVIGGPQFAQATDQYLPPSLPGFEDARIYPYTPDLRQARSLARGHTRGGKVVLYTQDVPLHLARAQIVKENLARIGLEVEIKGIAPGGYFPRLLAPGEPFDIAFRPFSADYLEPYTFINLLYDGRFIGSTNIGRFNSLTYNARMRRAARLQGDARLRAYARLDVQLSREAAPGVPSDLPREATLVSRRLGCLVLRPDLDLTAVCLKE